MYYSARQMLSEWPFPHGTSIEEKIVWARMRNISYEDIKAVLHVGNDRISSVYKSKTTINNY